MMHLYVGNLSLKVTDEKLRDLFSQYGEVQSANVYKDRFREDAEALGFVEMPSEEEAVKAISELNGTTFEGTEIQVHKSRNAEIENYHGSERRHHGS
jgi:RNA recognition motif-containing protein